MGLNTSNYESEAHWVALAFIARRAPPECVRHQPG